MNNFELFIRQAPVTRLLRAGLNDVAFEAMLDTFRDVDEGRID